MIFLSVGQNSGGGGDGDRRAWLLVPELQAIERRVTPTLAQQVVVTSGFTDGPILDDADAVGVDNRMQAVGNHDGRAPAAKTLDRALHLPFRFGIERGGGLVKQDDWRG